MSEDACKTLVNSLVTSRLVYSNPMLYGINKQQTNKLQRAQNAAARLVTRTRKSDHITPVLMSLQWSPVEFRSQYKLLLYVYKALNDYISKSLLRHTNQQGLCARSLHSSCRLQKPIRRHTENTVSTRLPLRCRTRCYPVFAWPSP